jgi:hypothetical protein
MEIMSTFMKDFIYLIVVIIILSYLVIPHLLEVPQIGSTWRKDQNFIPALQNISKLINEGEPIVSSDFDPTVYYFTGRPIEVPNNLTSINDLSKYMNKNNLNYLLIIEHQNNELNPKNRFDKMNNFTFFFGEIASFNTDSTSLHLYKRI